MKNRRTTNLTRVDFEAAMQYAEGKLNSRQLAEKLGLSNSANASNWCGAILRRAVALGWLDRK